MENQPVKKRKFDASVWKTGNSFVLTIPPKTIKKMKLKTGDDLEVTIVKS